MEIPKRIAIHYLDGDGFVNECGWISKSIDGSKMFFEATTNERVSRLLQMIVDVHCIKMDSIVQVEDIWKLYMKNKL